MILAVDIGNSNIVLGGFEGQKLSFVSRLKTDRHRMRDDWAVVLSGALSLYGARAAQMEGAIISSVVPQVTGALADALESLCKKRPLVLGPGLKTGLDLRIDNPAAVGSDFVADAVGALAKYEKPVLVFDLGTATKVCVLNRAGQYLGGAIMPGVHMGLDALGSGTAQLPHIGLSAPGHVIGPNTVEAMQSGAVYGTASLLDGMALRIQEELGEKATVVATGGIAGSIVSHCRSEVVYDANLLLEGLLVIYRRNRPRAV